MLIYTGAVKDGYFEKSLRSEESTLFSKRHKKLKSTGGFTIIFQIAKCGENEIIIEVH